MRLTSVLPLLLGLPLLAACGNSSTTTTGTTGTGGAGTGGSGTGGAGPTMALCTTPTTVACSDQIILAMNLQPDAAKGLITSTADGDGWVSNVDATAGGAFASKPDSYTYGKFTDQGLVKVDLADQDSLTSMAWDIAFRRYVIRINSADSGPSCVQGARVAGAETYEQITAEPAGLAFHADDYFTESCDIIPDGSGLPDSPATALSSFWTYPGCVQMTKHVFVLELASGRHLKLVVDDYYSPAVQDQCDTTGAVPMSNTGSGNIVLRWAFFK
jgi:hypothetical protein